MPTLGLFGANMGACAAPEGVLRVSALAEQIEPDYPILDPLVTLGLMAARTRRVRLATGIVILRSAIRSCWPNSSPASTS